MEFLPKEIDEYVVAQTQPEPQLLQELNRETYLKVLNPRMLSGHLQGRILSMLSHMIHPKRILEIGTYTGYSALCFAEGLHQNGLIYTIDINEELELIVRKYIEKSGFKNKIDYRIGNALEIIPTLDDVFDLVFIDADKENYSAYYDLVIDKVRQGGYVIADNVLWSGKVIDSKNNQDTDTKSLVAYTEKVNSDKRVQNVLFPVRDGLMVSRKV